MKNKTHRSGWTLLGLGLSVLALAGCEAVAKTPAAAFTLSSPDLAAGEFTDEFVLHAFGCTGQNVSPAVAWTNAPSGTKSFALQVQDLDAPTGSGFWHWAVYDIPADATSLARGAGNHPDAMPAGAFAGSNDFLDTGATGGNGNYGGPCPPQGDTAHRYVFTLYALAVDKIEEAAGVPKTATPALFSFVLNKGVGPALLGKASFTAKFGR
jgi:Raf kinase inhibitor-like YbhB/YbcL family protein